MNNHVRQKVYEWLLKITSNLTVLDRQQNDKTKINFSMNDKNELTTNMDNMHSDASKFFNKFNLSQYNITPEYINAFLEILNISKPHPVAKYEVDSCDEYCDGSFRDALFGYKSFHGYISLVVSTHGEAFKLTDLSQI